MKQNIYRIMVVSLFTAFFFALFSPASLMAQSESYLDTIYRAVNGNNTYSSDYETDTNVEILTEDASAETADSAVLADKVDESKAADEVKTAPITKDGKIDVNVVLSDMTRILIGMNSGLHINTSSFTIIDMGNAVSNTGTNTNTSTATNTSTGTTTNTSTNTGTTTNTSTNTSTNTNTNTNTGTTTNTSTNTSTNTGTTTNTDTDTNTGTNTPTDDPGLNPGTNTGTDTGGNPDPFGEDNTVTTTNTASDTGTSTGTATNTAEDIDDLKSKINSNYGIPLEDGTSKFTVKQLELMDATFDMMKATNSSAVNNFMKATTKIIRDKAVPENSTSETVSESDYDNVAGYVTKGKTDVHILDRASNLFEKNIKELEELNKRKFSQTELEEIVEDNYVHTIVHEMTHAFQNSEKEKGNDLVAKWTEKFWESDTKIKSDGIAPSSYAKTAPYEDMAECVAYYVTGGGIKYTNENGKEVFRAYNYTGATMDIERYNWIKYNIFNGTEFLDTANSTVGF